MKSFLTTSSFPQKSISRLLGVTSKNDKTRAFWGAEIRDMRHNIYSSNTEASSSVTTTSLPVISRVGRISLRNTSNLSHWNENIVGKILSTILPGVFTSGNLAVSRKSVSKLRIGSLSFLERAKTAVSGVPFEDHTMWWPRAIAIRVSGRDMFSSAKNFTSEWRETDNSIASGPRSGDLECRSNVLFGYGRPRVENGLDCLSMCKRVKNLPDHNARTLECEFASTDLRVRYNVFIDSDTFVHMPSSVAQSAVRTTSGDVCNNGRRTTVYLHTRNRFSFYFCANTRPIAYQRSCPRSGRLALNVVYRLMSRDVNRQLVDIGCFSLFAAAWFRKFNVPRNHPTHSYQFSDVSYSPERECFDQTIISDTISPLSRMVTLPMRKSSRVCSKNVENEVTVLTDGDWEARVLPRVSWLQRETERSCASATQRLSTRNGTWYGVHENYSI